jgi:D-alanine-D-alanine ligase
MLFLGFSADEPRVLGYEAKWHVGSSQYARTVRSFIDPVAEAGLHRRACQLAVAVWRECGLSGYARVDLRLDEAGQPCVLEANANPCLSSDAGFMAAAGRAGLGPAEVVGRVVAAAQGGHP